MVRIVKKPDERRKEILKAAREFFKTKEYEKATMQDLINTLNIAKGTLYHYFSSKDDLLNAVVEDLMTEELNRKKELMESSRCQGLNAIEKFKILVGSDTLAEDNEKLLENLHHSGNAVMHARQLGGYLVKLAPIFASVIEEGIEQGLFTTEHPRECAEFMLAGFQFLTDVGFYPWSQEQLVRRIKAFPSLIEKQLGAPEGSFSFIAGLQPDQ